MPERPQTDVKGGIVEKGWYRGKRLGYADSKWVYNRATTNEIVSSHVTALDHEWAVSFHAVTGAFGSSNSGTYSSMDANDLTAVVIRRVDDALYNYQETIVDYIAILSEREHLITERISDTRVAVGYQRLVTEEEADEKLGYDPGTGNWYPMPCVGIYDLEDGKLHHVVTIDLWEPYDAWNWWLLYERNVLSISPLSDNKFVVLHSHHPTLQTRFSHTGAETTSENFTLAATVCTFSDDGAYETGDSLILTGDGYWPMDSYPVEGAQERIVVCSSHEQRKAMKPEAKIGTAGLHMFPTHIRTCDINDLTITENRHNGMMMTDRFTLDIRNGLSSGYRYPRVAMLTDTEGVVAFVREADVEPPKWFRPVTLGGDPYADPSNPNFYEDGDLISNVDLYNADGSSRIVSGAPPNTNGISYPITESPAETAAVLRFTVGPDGSVSSSWQTHIMDASGGRWKNRDVVDGVTHRRFAHDVGPEHGVTRVQGFGIDVHSEGRAILSWAMTIGREYLDPYGGRFPVEKWRAPLNHQHANSGLTATWRAGWIVLDNDTPSGIAAIPFRHLGVQYSGNTSLNGDPEMDLKFFRDTNWCTATPAAYMYPDAYFQDGPGLSPELYPGWPTIDPEATVWDNELGYYSVMDGAVGWAFVDGVWQQVPTGPHPYGTLLAFDNWEATGYRDKANNSDTYNQNPWDFDYRLMEYNAHPDWEQWMYMELNVSGNAILQVNIWEIPPPPTDISARQREVKISRRKAR